MRRRDVFQAIFSWASLPMDLLDQGFGALGDAVRSAMPAGVLTDLLVDGIIAGVGGVLGHAGLLTLIAGIVIILANAGLREMAVLASD